METTNTYVELLLNELKNLHKRNKHITYEEVVILIEDIFESLSIQNER